MPLVRGYTEIRADRRQVVEIEGENLPVLRARKAHARAVLARMDVR
jgi:hypothetical protein